MSTTQQKERETVIKAAVLMKAEKIMEHHHGPAHVACLYWADAAAKAMRENGFPDAIVQAGTASWKIIPDELDDGVSPNRFTYLFEPDTWRNPFNLFNVLRKCHLPEMHCWAGCPKSQLIVDLALQFQPQQCFETTGTKWQTEKPGFFWGTQEDAKRLDYIYTPDVTACKLAMSLLENSRDGVFMINWFPETKGEK